MINIRKRFSHPTSIYLIVISLTILSASIGDFSEWNTASLIVVLFIMVVKAQLIIDYFMQLKQVKRVWRWTMSAFSMVIALIAFFLLR